MSWEFWLDFLEENCINISRFEELMHKWKKEIKGGLIVEEYYSF